jgi:nitrous oxide reductase
VNPATTSRIGRSHTIGHDALIGSVAAEHDGGAYTMELYFSSEAAAREGERKEPSLEPMAQMDEVRQMVLGIEAI